MKSLLKFIVPLCFMMLAPQLSNGQFLKKLSKKAKAKIEREAEKRSERRVNNKIDEEFDKAEDAIDGKNKKNNDDQNNQNNENSQTNKSSQEQNQEEQSVLGAKKSANIVWNRFDFVPGDEVIFEDGPDSGEEIGEFPSRWDLKSGNAEIMEIDGDNVICYPQGGHIIPYLKNSKEDYLPEIFTVEFDAFFKPGYARRLWIELYDVKNQPRLGDNERITIYVNGIDIGSSSGTYPSKTSNNDKTGGWRHVSLAFTKGKLKLYLDDTRLINIPHYEGNPTGISLEMDGYSADKPEDIQAIKNFRIAKGGVKYYDRVLSEGKIIVNGIKFDVNKATLKPESMGPINKIYQLMQKQPDLNFSVEGHTDSDGGDEANMSLSKARGKAVMNKLIDMGISPNRLKSTGFGESKPIDNNGTPEGKANNRRVEFVKFSGSSNSTTKQVNTNNGSSSVFDQLDRKTIGAKLESLPDSFQIPVSNKSGIVNGAGTVIVYATSDGLLGKMEILDVDKSNSYKLTLKYVTYNYDGSIHGQSNHLEVQGTYTCDLDKGTTENVLRSDEDFWFQRSDETTSSINPTELTILKVLK